MLFWKRHIKDFKKIFRKNFQIIDVPMEPMKVLEEFKGEDIDFGDHMLYETFKSNLGINCIFTHDSDFYNINDDKLNLITFNKNIIAQAESDSNLIC
jgi:hypothetical protein